MTVATCRSWESHRHRDSCHSCQADWERRVHLAQVGQRPRTLSKQAAFNTSFVLNSLYFLGAMSAQQVVTPCHPAIRQTNFHPGDRTLSASTPREPAHASQSSPHLPQTFQFSDEAEQRHPPCTHPGWPERLRALQVRPTYSLSILLLIHAYCSGASQSDYHCGQLIKPTVVSAKLTRRRRLDASQLEGGLLHHKPSAPTHGLHLL